MIETMEQDGEYGRELVVNIYTTDPELVPPGDEERLELQVVVSLRPADVAFKVRPASTRDFGHGLDELVGKHAQRHLLADQAVRNGGATPAEDVERALAQIDSFLDAHIVGGEETMTI